MRVVGAHVGEEQLRVGRDAGERRVHLVGDARREKAERREALLLLKLALEADAVRDVRDHEDRGPSPARPAP